MNTSFPASAHHAISCRRSRLTVCMAATCVAVLMSAWPAAAQAVYTYRGNNFMFFSCGPDPTIPAEFYCDVPADAGNPNTSYTRANFVLVTLTLNEPLPPNLPLQPILGRAGFSLVMNDGQQTLSFADLQSSGSFAFSGHVATDASGRISAWSLGLFPLDGSNRWIVTASPDVAIYGDQGVMGGVDFGVTCTSLDTASCIPGTWSSLPSGPGESIRNLISLLSTVSGLNPGQVSSLTDKLRDALASADAGLIKQAINQLNAFINEVRAAQKKIGVVMATTLTAAATAIIAML